MACGDCPKGLDKLVHGAVGLAQAAGHVMGIHAVPQAMLLQRVRACLGNGPDHPPCPHSGRGWFCGKCGCVIQAKLRVRSERCPDGRWEEENK